MFSDIKTLRRVEDLNLILIFKNARLLLMLLCKRAYNTSGKLPRYGKTTSNSFFLKSEKDKRGIKRFIQKHFNTIINQLDGKCIPF